MTGWKAVVGAVVIVGVIGIGAWSRFQPRSFGNGTIDIDPDDAAVYDFTSSANAKMKAVFTPVAATDASYLVWVLDDASFRQLEASDSDPTKITKLIEREGSGVLTIQELLVGPGTYHAVIHNKAKSKLSLKYEFFELSKSR